MPRRSKTARPSMPAHSTMGINQATDTMPPSSPVNVSHMTRDSSEFGAHITGKKMKPMATRNEAPITLLEITPIANDAMPRYEIVFPLPVDRVNNRPNWKADLKNRVYQKRMSIEGESLGGGYYYLLDDFPVRCLYPFAPATQRFAPQVRDEKTTALRLRVGWVDGHVFKCIAIWLARFCKDPVDDPEPLKMTVSSLHQALRLWITVSNLRLDTHLEKELKALVIKYLHFAPMAFFEFRTSALGVHLSNPMTDMVIKNLLAFREKELISHQEAEKICAWAETNYPHFLRVMCKIERKLGLNS
jgi:hypothetical protein